MDRERSLWTRRHPLWVWLGLRMSALALCASFIIVFGMWLYYTIVDELQLARLPADVAAEIVALRENPTGHEDRLWELTVTHFGIEEFLPGLDSLDWWVLLGISTVALIILVGAGLMVTRRLSSQFGEITAFARMVSEGDFSVRARPGTSAPREIAALSADFNHMTARLQQNERELLESSAILAHELRTPLNAAMGRIEGMIDNVFPRDEAQLAMVKRQLEDINRLVGDLHVVSLARAGQLSMAVSRFDAAALVRERLEWAGPALRDAGLAVEVRSDDGLMVEADRGRLGQALAILVANAVRHAAQGRSLRVDAAIEGPDLVLDVADRGPGVAPADLPRMADRFWRADPSRTRDSGGSGLGLAVAAAICRSHGGELTTRLREGGGLIVCMRMPVAAT